MKKIIIYLLLFITICFILPALISKKPVPVSTPEENNNNYIEPLNLTDNGIIYETTIDANSSSTFEFKMWLDYNSDNEAMDKAFVGKIEIEEIGQHE